MLVVRRRPLRQLGRPGDVPIQRRERVVVMAIRLAALAVEPLQRALERLGGSRGHQDRAADAMTPSIGLLADAYDFRGMRPARNARRPASTPSCMARALASGYCESAHALVIRTHTGA